MNTRKPPFLRKGQMVVVVDALNVVKLLTSLRCSPSSLRQICSVGACYALHRTFTSEPSKKSEIKKSESGRSILEEVLIKETKRPTTTAEKVKQRAENTFFYVILAASVAVLGTFCYLLFDQFFASDSPQAIYSSALALIRGDDTCENIFGHPIAGFGEETARGRRRHVANQKYVKDGRERIRVVFHVKGSKHEGIAQAEKELVDGSWEWRFLLVQTREIPPRTHILIDNRM
ncbi:hypothetical protein AB6A40_000032 [Gnathostoma spinigerum]|uniref:Mitochondrial import inner membrane translocase subunit Tim21 n=1 Tax=Gnathostoma spinigerum TaxID=75299 RepID=A0ABD6E1D7_9BILA